MTLTKTVYFVVSPSMIEPYMSRIYRANEKQFRDHAPGTLLCIGVRLPAIEERADGAILTTEFEKTDIAHPVADFSVFDDWK